LKRNRSRVLRRSAKFVVFAINATWAIPVVLVIRAIRPWVHVRMAMFATSRIGHFVADAAILLARRSLEPPGTRTIDVFWIRTPTCNDQWARMVRRQLFVRWWVRYVATFNKLIPGGAVHELELPSLSGNRAAYNPLRLSPARFTFTPDEDQRAKAWLKRRGWRDGEKFICLQVRDSAYLSTHPLHSPAGKGHWDYHDYRDSDIDTYVEAVQALVDRGYWVIRMGKVVHKRLPLDHQRVIDYPFAPDQDDLLDIWLSVHCHLFVSTSTGIDVIPWAYGQPPGVYVNALPLLSCASQVNNIWVPKHLRWKDSGAYLTLREHCEHPHGSEAQYEQAGIVIECLTPSEIAAAVLEGEQRLTGTWIETEADRDRQGRCWDVLRSCPGFLRLHDYIHPEARFGCAWLKSMGEAFLA
jgi:putative glycosyltransferase (TIGR04372 family)